MQQLRVVALGWGVAWMGVASALAQEPEEPPPTPQGAERAYVPEGPVRKIPALDTDRAPLSPAPDLGSPRASLYNLAGGCEANELDRAAHSLDTRRLPAGRDAGEVAKHLCYLLDRRVDVEWGQVSAHPAGTPESPPYGGETPSPRQNVLVGSLDLSGRPVDLRLQRIRGPGRPPVWLVDAASVAHVDALYEAHGPMWFESKLPAFLTRGAGFGFTVWEVLLLPLLMLAAWWVVWLPSRWLRRLGHRGDGERTRFEKVVDQVGAPVVLLVAALLFYLTLNDWLALRGHLVAMAREVGVLVLTVAAGWLVMRVVDGLAERVMRRHSESAEDDQAQEGRRALTLASIARRTALFLVLIVVVGVLLQQLELATAVGSALLGTAGAIAVIVAVAAHRVLGNILIGLQIAITKPLRIGDSVVFDGQWGRVESIHYTHVTVRTWDDRRLVVPFSYLAEHPFENWSSVSPGLIKPIYLYADFSVDVQAVRARFTDLCRASPVSDPDYEPQVLVTDFAERAVELRATCKARNPSDAWALHCLLREQMLEFIQRTPDAARWPREREQRVPAPS